MDYSNDLKWEKQCSQAVAKTNRVLGLIKRNFTGSSKETIISLYKSLVRPHLEYCCPIRNQHYFKMQRRATKSVWGMEKLYYEKRLKRLRLMHLDGRRVRSDLIKAFKMINGYCDVTLDLFF